jgi:D-tyrosyl-tRNA(Tyr) deacylase
VSSRYAVLLYPEDPVAAAVGELWGTPPAAHHHVAGAAVRQLSPDIFVLRRPGFHIEDRALSTELPPSLRDGQVPLVFPSIHQSESGRPALTVHPIGNFGASAEYGGEPSRLVPTAPKLMTQALRRLFEVPHPEEYAVSFEATHHGPYVPVPAFFIEIGTGSGAAPPRPLARELADLLTSLDEDSRDVVAVGLGGGHYAPHFTDLARDRRVAFGHLISRHAAQGLSPALAQEAWRLSPEARGVVYHRAEDERTFQALGVGPTLSNAAMTVRTIPDASSRGVGT